MDFNLTKEQQEFQKKMHMFSKAHVEPIAMEIDEQERFPIETVEKMMAEIEGHGSGGEAASGGAGVLYQGNRGLDQDRLEQLNKLYGFDQPPLDRFLSMMANCLVFDFGESYYHQKSVVALVI